MNPSWFRRVGLLSVGALATTAPVLLADHTAVEAGGTSAQQALAAAGWRDVLDGYRAPLIPDPSRQESAIVVLRSDPLARRPAAQRSRAAADIRAEQRTLEASLTGLGATVNFRYQNVVNGLAIRIPSGRLPLVAALPGVRSVHPVTYMAPATEEQEVEGKPLPGSTTTTPQTATQGSGTATIALIDAGVHSEHPWLGGGIGNTRLIVGGADFVQGNSSPESLPQTRVLEAHGTEMASVVLNSDAVRDLPIDRYPRMFAYRVMAAERVNGRTRMLARSDRVIAALDRAVDPNRDNDLDDHASVVLLGVSRGWPTSGDEPVREAADNADRAGSVVVAPAGNDGPSGDAATGTVAGPAASESVLTVGAAGATTAPRTGSLALSIGPASARLTGLPLMGASPTGDGLPVVVLSGSDGVGTGSTLSEYVDGRGQSRVRGALVVVARGGDTIPEKARIAAQAGARGLAVWDQNGDGRFPGIAADTIIPVPVVGLGREQGRTLLDHRDLTVTMSADPVTATGEHVASFSSRGPTGEGHSEPDVIAPGVDVQAAYPGDGPELLTARISGTSPAAAEVAAAVLRLRTDEPDLTPAQVRSVIVQSAESLPGEPASAQGAGLLRAPQARPVAIEPSIVSLRRAQHAPAGTVSFAVSSMTDAPLRLRAAIIRNGGTVVAPGEETPLAAHGRATMNVTVPAGFPPSDSTLALVDGDGKVVATAPFVIVPPETSVTRLAVPTVNTRSAMAQVTIGITGGGTARSLEVWLVPAGGATTGEPVLMSSDQVEAEWPSGAYRFSMTRRTASGEQVAAGRYRVRVRAVAPDGRRMVRLSGPFVLK